jgi:predicted transcriptional regulator
MERALFAFKHKLGVQFRYKIQNTKMKKNTAFLDGSEKSMIPIIKNNTDKLPLTYKRRVVSLEEFSAGTGISDLTIFTVDNKLLSKRQKSEKQPVTSKNQIQVLLTLLGSKQLTIAEIMEKVALSSNQTVQKILEQLIECKLVVNIDGKYSASYSLTDSTSENIIAIEAKVRDWKSGIRQAMRYKEYADYSYLAIYENNVSACFENIEVFKRLGIGLIGVSDEGIKVHLPASLSDMTTVENKVLAFERFFSAIDERYESFVAWNGFATNNTA